MSTTIPDISRLNSRPVGTGSSEGHFGEYFQGMLLTASGMPMRALVSVRFPCGVSIATFMLGDEHDDVAVLPSHKTKAAMAARLTLETLGAKAGGHLTIQSSIVDSQGFGASTADTTAATRAVANALGVRLPASEIGRIVVMAEKAADGIMFESTVLFAQRDGIVLEDFGRCLPPVVIVGALVGSNVDTLALEPAPYSRADISRFEMLRVRLRAAARNQDVQALADVATASARINQRHLPMPGFEALEESSDRCGAAGLVISHSGAVGGLIFDPSDPGVDALVGAAQLRLNQIGLTVLTTFSTTQTSLQTTITEAAA